MEKKILLILITILSFSGYSQIKYEKGYFINNSEQKTECLIKNFDWKNNPIDFEYKISEEGESLNANIENVKEFGIYNASKFVRATVEIDKSSEKINSISHDKNPVFVEEQLFLKVLLDGKYSLYHYKSEDLERFFYKTNKSKIEQLIYKSYMISSTDIAKNNKYKQQLWSNLNCSSIKMDELERLEYNKNSLIKFFIKFNECNNSIFENYDVKVKRDLFNLNLRLHINNSSLNIKNEANASADEINLKNKYAFGLGAEAEIILPFNKNKWALIIEPTYQNFKSEETTDVKYVSGRRLTTSINYKSIEVPSGIRYYMFLNDNSKLFIDAVHIFDFNFNSTIEFTRASDNSNYGSLDVKTSNNFGFGFGYKFKDKYSLELRYYTGRNLTIDYLTFTSNYKKIGLIFGYTLF